MRTPTISAGTWPTMCGSEPMFTWSIWDPRQPITAQRMCNTKGTGDFACPLRSCTGSRVMTAGSRGLPDAIRLPVSLEQPCARGEMRPWLSSIPRYPRLFHEAPVCALFRNSSFGSHFDDANCQLGVGRACRGAITHRDDLRGPAAANVA